MTDDTEKRLIAAIVLPAKEGFSEHSVGAIGLLVRRVALATRGFDNVVIGARSAVPTFPGFVYFGLRGARIAGRPMNWLYARLVARAVRQLRPAVIEVHNRPPLATYLARRFANTPVILVLHNDPHQARGADSAEKRKQLLQRLDAVVLVSNWLRQRFLAGVIRPTNQPEVIRNCIDPAEMPKPLHHAERDKLILFVGRLVHNKGADTFVAAAAGALRQLPGWRAMAIGADSLSSESGETEFLRGLHDAARGTAIEFTGYRSHAETMATMARAAIVVMPSRWEEPFGLVALEALASGAALVCSNRGALPEVAEDAAVYVDPDDAAAVEQAIVDVANDPERRRVLSAFGRARARAFSAAAAGRALERLRRKLLGGDAASVSPAGSAQSTHSAAP